MTSQDTSQMLPQSSRCRGSTARNLNPTLMALQNLPSNEFPIGLFPDIIVLWALFFPLWSLQGPMAGSPRKSKVAPRIPVRLALVGSARSLRSQEARPIVLYCIENGIVLYCSIVLHCIVHCNVHCIVVFSVLHTVLYCYVLHILLHCIVHCIVLYCIALYCTLYCNVLCNVLYCNVLYFVLYCIVL